jgi:hypothetical protein
MIFEFLSWVVLNDKFYSLPVVRVFTDCCILAVEKLIVTQNQALCKKCSVHRHVCIVF